MIVLALTVAYVLVVLFLLLLSLKANYRWQVKAAIIVICSVFYVVTWKALPDVLGWPIEEPLPEEFQLVSQYIEQPSKQTGSEGAIYMWVIDLGEGEDKIPRAYKLPYVEQLHEDIIEASSSSRPQRGKRVKQSGNNVEGTPSSNIKFEEMRPPRLPPKE